MRSSLLPDPLERALERLPARVGRWVLAFRDLHPQHEVVAFRGCCEVIVRRKLGDGYSLAFVSGDPARPEFREVS